MVGLVYTQQGPNYFGGQSTSKNMLTLTMTPYKARGPQRIPGGQTDGFGAEFKVHGLRTKSSTYTIFQQIRRVVAWDPADPEFPSPDFDSFTEAWPSRGRSKILDKFMVPIYMRQGSVGSMVVLARAWAIEGNKHNLKVMGTKRALTAIRTHRGARRGGETGSHGRRRARGCWYVGSRWPGTTVARRMRSSTMERWTRYPTSTIPPTRWLPDLSDIVPSP